MRDPELMQRADRAAIALEEAWERWRGMHGLGMEPLPPVSSYVGYSLEEPFGQPRVVFGLRADEAELLASLLDGHDCVGPIYTEVSTRSDWRQSVGASGPQLARPYPGNSVSVPAQARPPAADRVGAGGSAGAASVGIVGPATDDSAGADSAVDGEVAAEADPETLTANGAGKADRTGRSRVRRPGKAARNTGKPTEGERDGAAEAAAEAGAPEPGAEAPALAPLPDMADYEPDEDETLDDKAQANPAPRTSKPVKVPAQGPGYRGPRYQGFPPRYDPDQGPAKAERDADDDESRSHPARRSAVAKLNRATRRRTAGS